MKNRFTILTMAILAISLAACDPVDEDSRFVESGDVNPERKVLVEEFTGQFCRNCPLGHDALNNIKTMYGENAVIVSIHAGDQAFDDPDMGLKTPDGDSYAGQYGIQEYPSAVVNHNSGAMSDRSQWQGAVYKAACQSSTADIALSAHVQDGNIVIESTLTSTTGSRNVSYQLWVTENNISTLQQDGDEYVIDYVHNHVYRASVNGIGGESTVITESANTLTHAIALDAKWNPSELNIVAFIYDKKGVLQAEETKVE